ncbi:hypothetical protein [Streptomyces winkii]|uniref:hypothetical protein n=1 Tax=Streptomyces winkii TaxID=3051178 RepID=UPI0028D61514|nr:hypothetical protein [Streptomyces sp. DSM 40971]
MSLTARQQTLGDTERDPVRLHAYSLPHAAARAETRAAFAAGFARNRAGVSRVRGS